MSYVYVFGFGFMVKVGRSSVPANRLRQIEYEKGVVAEETFVIWVEKSASQIELMTHKKLERYLVPEMGREYFSCDMDTAKRALIHIATRLVGNAWGEIAIVAADHSDAQKKATARYNKKAYDRIDIIVPKGKREIVKAFAQSRGMSANKFINQAIDKAMGDT